MSSEIILHALGLHLYQPAGNLRRLLSENADELRRILLCYARLVRHAHKYSRVARIHVALSPVLLEQLRDPELIEACLDFVDIPEIVEGLRNAASIEFVGSGSHHAPLPLIPREDWEEQLHDERVLMEATLGRTVKGYWPPADIVVPELIPALLDAGYEYLLLPADALTTTAGGEVDPYRAYRLCHGKSCIPVVPLDRGFSRAQEQGLDAPWFADALRGGVAQAPAPDAPYLLTTWSDGENGEWFRREDEEHGFFGRFFSPYMEFCETGEFPVRPVFVSEYLHSFNPSSEAGLRVETDPASELFPDAAARAAHRRLLDASARYWALARPVAGQAVPSRQAMRQARKLLLCAEESGMLLGGTPRRAELLDLLTRAERLMGLAPPPAAAKTGAATATRRKAERTQRPAKSAEASTEAVPESTASAASAAPPARPKPPGKAATARKQAAAKPADTARGASSRRTAKRKKPPTK